MMDFISNPILSREMGDCSRHTVTQYRTDIVVEQHLRFFANVFNGLPVNNNK